MKQFKFIPVLFAIALIASACGAEPVTTINAADVQSTAAAAAFTMVAETQAAIPTNTPLPPTETPTNTPRPTDTPASLATLPTIQATATSGAASNSNTNTGGAATVDPCSTRILSPKQGRETIIRIVNQTKVSVTVSMYLNETASHGECGYRGFTLAKNSDIVYTDLVQGCYNLWAWSDDPKGKFNSSGGGCINNSDKWTFEVDAGSVKFVGP